MVTRAIRDVIARTLGSAVSAALFVGCNAILGNESDYSLLVADAGRESCTLNGDCAKGHCTEGACVGTDPSHDPLLTADGGGMGGSSGVGGLEGAPGEASIGSSGFQPPDAGIEASGGAVSDPCVGVNCNHPPAKACADAAHFTAYDPQGSCSGGTCSYTSRTIACTCEQNACTTDACDAVTCSTPPTPMCPDASTRRTFASTGTCSGGSCSYAHTDTKCGFGCSGGQCNPDPCAGVTCTTPPPATCASSTTVRKYASTGTCSGGKCSYKYTDGTCTNQTCFDGACTGQCAPGQKRCSNNGVETCTSVGTWSTPVTCVNQACVKGTCQGVCAPNPVPTRCLDGNTPEYCDATGQYAKAPDCTGTKPVCLNGSCVQ